MQRFLLYISALIATISSVFFTSGEVFALPASDTPSLNTEYVISGEKGQTTQEIINEYITEAYKIHGKQILQELDVSLNKIFPRAKVRSDAYASIQKTLTLKKESIRDDTSIGENYKIILSNYLTYLIQELEIRQKKIETPSK